MYQYDDLFALINEWHDRGIVNEVGVLLRGAAGWIVATDAWEGNSNCVEATFL